MKRQHLWHEIFDRVLKTIFGDVGVIGWGLNDYMANRGSMLSLEVEAVNFYSRIILITSNLNKTKIAQYHNRRRVEQLQKTEILIKSSFIIWRLTANYEC